MRYKALSLMVVLFLIYFLTSFLTSGTSACVIFPHFPVGCEILLGMQVSSKSTVNSRSLESVAEQRNVGVLVRGFLKMAIQVGRVVNKAFCQLAFIGKGIECKR